MNIKYDQILENLIQNALKNKISDQKSLQALKNSFSLKHKISSPTNVSLIKAYNYLLSKGKINENNDFFNLIIKRKIRSESGIANITVLTKNYKCPGKCIFCPSEPRMPKSYLSNEPAMMRAILNDFDAYNQVKNRLKGLKRTGHPTDKIEIIVAGGTFSYYPRNYQTNFIKQIYNALNEDKKTTSLKNATLKNETAEHRCVGLSLETRPDWINKEEIIRMRKLGATKVEIGIQTLDDEILSLNKRGHNVQQVRKAMKMLKDAGFKINAHFMPNLYGSSIQKDLEMFKKLFDDTDFRPDWLKIYPCVVTPYSDLEKLYKAGKHQPYTDNELMNLLMEMKKLIPEYVRVARLYRDIPAESILGGSKISNMRQIIHEKMAKKGVKCKCIRCREIKGLIPGKVELIERKYESSNGMEYFLSFEDKQADKLIAFLRLRISDDPFLQDLKNASVIRELHTYGVQIPINKKSNTASQHKGYGKKLIERAGEITKSHNLNKLAVISGVGVREYYRKQGFKMGETYMIKRFNKD